MKRLNHLLLILIAMITMGCGDSAGEKQQELEIQALNQAISQVVNNATSIQEVVAQLPGECIGVELENAATMVFIRCQIEGIFLTYLLDDNSFGQPVKVGDPNLHFLLDQNLSCSLLEQPPVENDVNLILFSNESTVADLSSGTTARFVLLQDGGDFTEFQIPCNPFSEQERP